MFSLSGKKSGADTTDKVWMDTDAMYRGFDTWLNGHPNGLIVSWFIDDLQKIQSVLSDANKSKIVLSNNVTNTDVDTKQLIFAGHYPLSSVEDAFAEKMGLKKVVVHSSLKSPLFKHFGGDKIIEVAKGMGMKEDEAIEHFLVSSAITKTQGKIADKVSSEMVANSEEDWMRLNLQSGF